MGIKILSVLFAPVIFIFGFIIFAISAPSCNGEAGKTDYTKIEYITNEDGQSCALSKVGRDVTELEIPAEIDGKPVTRISADAFTYKVNGGCSGWHTVGINLQKLTIPASITVIEGGAFCKNESDSDNGSGIIDSVYYLGTLADWCVMQIGTTPFSSNTDFYIGEELITEITLDESTPKITANAFKSLSTLKNVEILFGVEEIGASAFEKTGISILHLPDSVTALGSCAFKGCTELTQANLGAGITDLPQSCFDKCENLLAVNLAVGLKSMGEGAFNGCGLLNDIDLSECTLQTIPKGAFANCKSLTSIVIPQNVTAIEDYAFAGCIKLLEVFNLSELDLRAGSEDHGGVAKYAYAIHNSLEDNSSLFQDDDGFIFYIGEENIQLVSYSGGGGDIVLPESVEDKSYSIRFSAFAANPDITSAVIPRNVTSVGDKAFFGCNNLTAVEICGANYIGDYAFSATAIESVVLCEELEQIGSQAFSECKNLQQIILPQSLKSLGDGAFECSGLTEITLPDQIATVSYSAFYKCGQLKKATLKGVKEIDRYAFYGCALEEVIFNEGLAKIGEYAFGECYNIKKLHFPASLTDFANNFTKNPYLEEITVAEGNPVCYSIGNCLIERGSNILLLGCINSVIPADGSVKTIGDKAFYASNLTNLVLPYSITTIGNSAFYECANLTQINLPESVGQIGEYAFAASGLNSITIPEGVQTIADSTFSDCKSLKNVVLPSTLKSIDGRAFLNSGLTSIVIPKNVTKIGWAAFSGTQLTSAKFEASDSWDIVGVDERVTFVPTLAKTNAKMLSETYCYAEWLKY